MQRAGILVDEPQRGREGEVLRSARPLSTFWRLASTRARTCASVTFDSSKTRADTMWPCSTADCERNPRDEARLHAGGDRATIEGVKSLERKQSGAPGWTRTSYPRLRRSVLYPDELRARGFHRSSPWPGWGVHSRVTSAPATMSAAPTTSCHVSDSPSTSADSAIVRARLSLSIGATRDAGASCSARTYASHDNPVPRPTGRGGRPGPRRSGVLDSVIPRPGA